ncbi:MAG: hypothetical protein LBL15_01025 [Oscillospiraceae bacterium]|jgi:energy-coupling factor transport system substrate-specific component|nr:hypothetical protein [Oscillospiraceae bacterium]
MTFKARRAVRDITVLALCAAVMVAVQVGLAVLPNVELVSLLVLMYALVFGSRALYIIYVFVLAEGLIFGFQLWWLSYLYVWTILAGAAWLLRAMRSALGWAVLSGVFGLLFGALCAIPYLFIGGWPMAVAYWVSGIPFDLIHGAANFALCLALWRPLYGLLTRVLHKQIPGNGGTDASRPGSVD